MEKIFPHTCSNSRERLDEGFKELIGKLGARARRVTGHTRVIFADDLATPTTKTLAATTQTSIEQSSTSATKKKKKKETNDRATGDNVRTSSSSGAPKEKKIKKTKLVVGSK